MKQIWILLIYNKNVIYSKLDKNEVETFLDRLLMQEMKKIDEHSIIYKMTD